MCFKTACYEILTDSYKGNQYLCENCYKNYQKLFKETKKTDERK